MSDTVTSRMGLGDAQTLLFVPGDRPERFAKAAAAGADVVIVDLEDAVGADSKGAARSHLRDWLDQGGRASVRINAPGTPWFRNDLDVLKDGPRPLGIVLPMASDPKMAEHVHNELGVNLLVLVETAAGVLAASRLAATPGVVRLGLGALDLAADLGTEDPTMLRYVRAGLVIASRAVGLAGPIDTPTVQLSEPDRASQDAIAARDAGMGGKLCIHPAQVAGVKAAFSPTPEQITWAERVLAAGAGGGVSVVDGAMIDEPVLARARSILART